MYFSFVVFQCVNNFVVLQCALVVFQNLSFKCLYLCCVECLSTFVVLQVNDESLNSSPSVAKFKAPAKSVLKQTRVRGTSGDIECM